jgi:c-di-GMP-binding flagellar brake protein YcgR
MKNSKEQRKAKRYNCAVPVDGKQGSPFDHTRTVDISRNGIGFISDSALPLNQKIAVEIALSPEGEPVVVMGVVKWVRKLTDSEQYRIGMTFSQVLSGSQTRLNQYLRVDKSLVSSD